MTIAMRTTMDGLMCIALFLIPIVLAMRAALNSAEQRRIQMSQPIQDESDGEGLGSAFARGLCCR